MRIIAGEFKGRRLSTPRGATTRPTADQVRIALMDTLGPRLPDARVLDLFAGSGSVGLEALSRAAAHATFVARDRRAAIRDRLSRSALRAGPRRAGARRARRRRARRRGRRRRRAALHQAS